MTRELHCNLLRDPPAPILSAIQTLTMSMLCYQYTPSKNSNFLLKVAYFMCFICFYMFLHVLYDFYMIFSFALDCFTFALDCF